MSAEATNPAEQGSFGRRRARPLIDLRNLRRFGRAALLGPAPRGRVPDAIEHVAKVHRGHHPGADLEVLRRAYELAESSHRGQMRKSGEPYITHPLAVTLILAELGAETTTLTASLLHDTVEDTEVTLAQVREEFGEEVRYLVDGVTKLEKVDYGAAAEPETFRKMLVATGNDVRVMSIKLADRLHNMRTLGVMRPEKQARIAKVTRDVLIPLAERLGVQALKTELEDLVFAILHPEEYARTRELIAEHATRIDPLAETARSVRTVLDEAGIAADVLVRPRHIVSVYRVRRKRGELSGADLGRLLVLVGEDADCYAVLGELHTCFTPVISEFKDFIAAPKFNLYQSLHTAIAGERGKLTEVLIRTQQMHKVAEAGVVALGNPYAATATSPAVAVAPADGAGTSGPRSGADGTEGTGVPHLGGLDGADGERVDPTRPGWLSRLLDWQRAASDSDTFWSSLRDDLAQDREITVFAADGTALSVPDGASCVDAVYARYGPAGHSCVGARVNGRLATLSTVLRDGDGVEFLMATGRDAAASGPSPEWLAHARTPAARIAITHWLDAHPAASDLPEALPEPDAGAPHAGPADSGTHVAPRAEGARGDATGQGAVETGSAHAGTGAAAADQSPRTERDTGTSQGAGAAAAQQHTEYEELRAPGGAGDTERTATARSGPDEPQPGTRSVASELADGAGETGHGARGADDGASSPHDGAQGARGARDAERGGEPSAAGPRSASPGGVPVAARSSKRDVASDAGPSESRVRAAEPGGEGLNDGAVTAPVGAVQRSGERGAYGAADVRPAAGAESASQPSAEDGSTGSLPGLIVSSDSSPMSAGADAVSFGGVTGGGGDAGEGVAAPSAGAAGRAGAGGTAVDGPDAGGQATGARTGASPGGHHEARTEPVAAPAGSGAGPGRGGVSTLVQGAVTAPASASGHDARHDGNAAAGGQQESPAGADRRRGAGVVVDQPGATVRLAGCCTPVPPDEVTGFAVRGGAVTVHRAPCPVVARMTATGREPVGVRWQSDADEAPTGYRVTLCAEAFSRPHLLADLTEVIAVQGAEVISAAVEPPYEQRVRHTYTLQLPDAGRLPLLMRAMRQVPSVYDVTRAGHELATVSA
ncbi:HD domain-containing protein [Streptomyces sp. HSW2009]|uniref:HD domain-containing protein n=1 Tax=Streptomyces sp. HSW2009 TaxID=3142890 RepID=UPI0032EF7541